MDSSAARLDESAPAGKQTAGWMSVALRAGAAALAALLVVCLMLSVRYTHLPTRERLMFAPLMTRAAQWGAGLGSREITYSNAMLTAKTLDGMPVEMGTMRLSEGVLAMPLLLLASVTASWIAARLLKLAWGSTTVLVALAAGLSVLGLPVISGFLQGWGLAVECNVKYVMPISRLALDAAPMMVCGLVALSWVVVDHLWVDEATRAPRAETADFGRPVRLWAATAAAMALAICLLLMAMGASVLAEAEDPMGSWRTARFGAATAAAGVSAVMLLIALLRGRKPRWAWIGLCVLVPLGGQAAGGVALLLAALSARVPAVARAVEDQMPVKKMPVKKKRKYRL
jgi:hypothetical protein